jgi:hypothetical protein
MADKKISALTSSTTPLAGTEVLPIVQSSTTVKVAVSDLTAGRSVAASAFVAPTIGAGSTSNLSLQSNGTTNATLDTSGNFLIGTTTAKTTLTVNGGGATGLNSSAFAWQHYQQAASSYTATSIQSIISGASAYLTFSTNGNWTNGNASEAARIDSNGYFLLGKTSATTSSKFEVDASSNVSQFWHTGSSDTIGIYMRHGRGLSGFSGKMISFRRNDNTEVGSIVIGDSTTSYNTSSDYRLKNSIAPMTGALEKVALLKPCTYKWNSSGSNGQGFIAHELAEVIPDCVTGEKDAVDEDNNPKYQGIDTSFLVATLTAAIQEQQAIIESLKARLDAANL